MTAELERSQAVTSLLVPLHPAAVSCSHGPTRQWLRTDLGYEYYLDYLDLIPVDEKKLKANKHSIVIVFWVSLAAFVLFLFLILLYMSWSGYPQGRGQAQHSKICPWLQGLLLPLCIWRQSSQGTSQSPPSSIEEGGSGEVSGSEGQLGSESLPISPSGSPALLSELILGGDPQASDDTWEVSKTQEPACT